MEIIFETKKLISYENEDYSVKYIGLPFIPGYRAGDQSIRVFLQLISNHSIEHASMYLGGTYFIKIKYRKNDITQIITDNIGICKLFYSDKIISTSFLSLINNSNLQKKDIDKRSIIEFLRFGTVLNNRTLFKNIHILPKSKILSISDKGDMNIIKKDNSTPSVNTILNIEDYFRKALRNQKASIDITAGIDSRYNVCLFSNHESIRETFTSDKPENIDASMGSIISEMLGFDHYIHTHHVDKKIENDLDDIWELSDGLIGFIVAHRQYQVSSGRNKRNIDLSISGVGGEFFKEILYMQQFPFIDKNVNYNLLYDLRFEIFPFDHEILHTQYRAISNELRRNILTDIKKYQNGDFSKTINNIWYEYKIPYFIGFYVSRVTVQYHNVFLPFLERIMFEYSKQIQLNQKIFDIWHRKQITRLNENIASIKTSQEISVSSKYHYMIKDILISIFNRIKRLAIKFGQRIFSRTYILQSPVNKDIYALLESSGITEDSIQILKEFGILDINVEVSDINRKHIGNIITLAFVLKKISST